MLARIELRGHLVQASLVTLFCCGVILLGKGTYMQTKAELAQILIAHSWQNREHQARPEKPWQWADIQAIARLTIPELKIKTYVMEDANAEALAFGPGHLRPDTPLGSAGHVIIAGHRDSHFEFLQELKIGHIIEAEHYQGNRVHYKVTAFEIIDSTKSEIAVSPTENLLTLVTCYPFNELAAGGPLRYLVSAEPINSDFLNLIREDQAKPDYSAKPTII